MLCEWFKDHAEKLGVSGYSPHLMVNRIEVQRFRDKIQAITLGQAIFMAN